MRLLPTTRQPSSVPPLRESEWAPQVDRQRLQEQDALALLRGLAERSIRYLYDGAEQPALDRKQTHLLRPLTGRTAWTQKDRRYAASAIREPIQLSDPPDDLGTSEVTVLTIASTRPRNWLSRRLARLRASRAALLHGDQFLPVFLEAAWSDPALSYELMKQVRIRWRAATLFHPDEPDWPASLSPATFHFLVAIAVRRPAPSLLAFPLERAQRRFAEVLDKGLPAAAGRLAERSETEQLIVLDAAHRVAGNSKSNAQKLAEQLPAAKHSPYTLPEVTGSEDAGQDTQAPAGEADHEAAAQTEVRNTNPASFIQRLKRQQL